MDAKGKNKMMTVKKEAAFVESDDEEHDHCMQQDDSSSKKTEGIVLKKGSSGASGCGGGGLRNCQVEECMADLRDAKQYHRRHKVCEVHAKAEVVLMAGMRQRFCQQCSRFHELSEFDETKRSCRRRLAGHNERRRKNAAESNREGSSHKGTSNQLKELVCRQVDDKGRIKMAIQETPNYKNFQIR